MEWVMFVIGTLGIFGLSLHRFNKTRKQVFYDQQLPEVITDEYMQAFEHALKRPKNA